MERQEKFVETHPLEPFLPENAVILMLGSFPPRKERWSMDFFYPNFINDMWRIFGLVCFKEKEHFILRNSDETVAKKFDKDRIIDFCTSKGIALYDTATEVHRLKDNASDRFLEIMQPTDVVSLLERLPACRSIVTTGQKATDVIAEQFGCKEPQIGGYTECRIRQDDKTRLVRFWRMPSSSRAYPLSLEKKAEHYKKMLTAEGII